MKSFGETIRDYREERELPLRTVAAFLDIDPAILSKVERSKRKMSKDQVLKLAEYFKVDKDELIVSWLSDRILYEIEDEEQALNALHAAENKIKYKKKNIRK